MVGENAVKRPYVRIVSDGLILRLHIQPNATKSGFAGLYGDKLKIRLHAPPVDGKANAELLNFLSRHFGVPKKGVIIVSGLAGREKTVKLFGKAHDFLTILP